MFCLETRHPVTSAAENPGEGAVPGEGPEFQPGSDGTAHAWNSTRPSTPQLRLPKKYFGINLPGSPIPTKIILLFLFFKRKFSEGAAVCVGDTSKVTGDRGMEWGGGRGHTEEATGKQPSHTHLSAPVPPQGVPQTPEQ